MTTKKKTKKMGRPPKNPRKKYRAITIYLDPEVIAKLDQEIRAHNRKAVAEDRHGYLIELPSEEGGWRAGGRGRWISRILEEGICFAVGSQMGTRRR